MPRCGWSRARAARARHRDAGGRSLRSAGGPCGAHLANTRGPDRIRRSRLLPGGRLLGTGLLTVRLLDGALLGVALRGVALLGVALLGGALRGARVRRAGFV